MSEQNQTTNPAAPAAVEALALAMAQARTSPPEYATASDYDRKMATRVLKTLEAAGWKISHGQ